MRVIAGVAKGRRLKVPGVAGLRPTSDRARETLFNILSAQLERARFLDVFAGSGAIGIEALSRGAAHATFVECSRRAVTVLRQNLQACGFGDQGRVLGADWSVALRRLGRDGEVFDIAFFDPPYDWGAAHRCVEWVRRHRLLDQSGWVIVEHRSSRPVGAPAGWRVERCVEVGDTAFSIFELEDPDIISRS